MKPAECASSLPPLCVLLAHADEAETGRCEAALRQVGYDPTVQRVQTTHEFFQRITERDYDAIVAAETLPGWCGFDTVELTRQLEKDIPVILLGDDPVRPERAEECLRRGVADYVNPDRLSRLGFSIRRVLERQKDRKKASELGARLMEGEERWRRLAEVSAEPLLVLEEGRVALVNPAAVRFLGAATAAELVGREFESLVEPDSQAQFRREFDRLKGGMEPALFEGCFQRADGQKITAKIAAVALTYRGRPAIHLVVRDVSERRRVDEAIKALAAFAQHNPNPVLEFSGDGRLTYFNDAAAELARQLGRPHPGDLLPAEAPTLVRSCLGSGRKTDPLLTRSGSRTLSWSFFPIQSSRVVHCYVEDITERQNLEAQLRHAQKLDSVGRLASGVAHDFNNLITVMQGHIGMLRSEPNLGAHMQESLQQLSRAAERASKLANQLLTFNRRSVIQPRRIEVNDLLTSLGALLQRTLGEDITLQFSYASDLPPVYGDAGLIEQVVMNLALNARDAMSKGGILMLSTALVNIDAAYVERHPVEARPGRFVCLSVTDTGCGMDSVTLGRLFEPFFTTKEFGKGSGLGLATAYGIVKQHGGWIDVTSQLGRGSTFKVYLPPTDSPAAQDSPRPATDDARGHGETILVVEDEPPVRWTLKTILEKHNYRVLEAGNGIEALAVWHQHHEEIALLLSDVVMPSGLSGQELAEQFTAQKPGLRVLFMSGYSAQTAGPNLTDIEGLNFIQKPFDGPRLAQAVQRVLSP